jgi:hypothetical protein
VAVDARREEDVLVFETARRLAKREMDPVIFDKRFDLWLLI